MPTIDSKKNVEKCSPSAARARTLSDVVSTPMPTRELQSAEPAPDAFNEAETGWLIPHQDVYRPVMVLLAGISSKSNLFRRYQLMARNPFVRRCFPGA